MPPVAELLEPALADATLLRQAFARLASGVTVVTTMSPDGPKGMTATAVCSVSLDPPLVLACLHNSSRTLAAVRDAGAFAVNILRADQAGTATAFATPVADQARFADVAHRPHEGVPVLAAALAWVTCRVTATYPGGDHTIVLGAATGIGLGDGPPLVRHRGGYRQLRPARPGRE